MWLCSLTRALPPPLPVGISCSFRSEGRVGGFSCIFKALCEIGYCGWSWVSSSQPVSRLAEQMPHWGYLLCETVGGFLTVLHIPVIVELEREASFSFFSLFYLQGVSMALKSFGKDFREKVLVHELDSMECF